MEVGVAPVATTPKEVVFISITVSPFVCLFAHLFADAAADDDDSGCGAVFFVSSVCSCCFLFFIVLLLLLCYSLLTQLCSLSYGPLQNSR